jgi:hypothetical protein
MHKQAVYIKLSFRGEGSETNTFAMVMPLCDETYVTILIIITTIADYRKWRRGMFLAPNASTSL